MRLLPLLVLLAACGGSTPSAERPRWVDPSPPPDPPRVLPNAVEALPCDPAAASDASLSAEQVVRTLHGCANDGQLDAARAGLDAASERLSGDPVAHYVYARVLLAQRQLDGNACEREAYLTEILDRAVRAGADPQLRAAMTTQELFAEVRPALRYRVAIGVELATATDAQLQGLRFYSPGNGAYGSHHQLLLGPGGVATLRDLTFEPDAGQPRWEDRTSTWRVEAGTLILGDGRRYPLRDTGVLNDGSGTLPDWLDVPPECSA